MEWLRIQLKIMRDRGMKAMLMGHVPPARVDSKESWDETCWQKYTLWVQQYRDVIVGSLYGHMNIDHFMLQDFEQIDDHTKKGDMAAQTRTKALDGEIRLLEDGEVTVASASDYLLSLRDFWARLPSPLAGSNRKLQTKSESWDEEEEDKEDETSIWDWLISKVSSSRKHKKTGKSAKKKYLEKIGGKYAQRYSASLVSPSVVPNYYPTLRIIEYNITGLEHLHVQGSPGRTSSNLPSDQEPFVSHEFSDDERYKREVETFITRKEKQKKKEKAAKHSKKFRFKVPEGPSKSAPPGPAYSPQVFTWTRYTQYFANLTRINNDFVDSQHHTLDTDSEPTISTNDLAPRTIFGLQVSRDSEVENKGWKEGKHGKHQGKKPRPEPHPKEFEYEVEYDTKDRKFPDLTVRRWVEYARKIGSSGAKAADFPEYEDEDEVADTEDQLEAERKKHNKHKKHHKASKEWFTFVKRAFVGTMDPREIKEVFGLAAPMVEEAQEEVMEL